MFEDVAPCGSKIRGFVVACVCDELEAMFPMDKCLGGKVGVDEEFCNIVLCGESYVWC
jgi:hypothetical protein